MSILIQDFHRANLDQNSKKYSVIILCDFVILISYGIFKTMHCLILFNMPNLHSAGLQTEEWVPIIQLQNLMRSWRPQSFFLPITFEHGQGLHSESSWKCNNFWIQALHEITSANLGGSICWYASSQSSSRLIFNRYIWLSSEHTHLPPVFRMRWIFV